MLARDGSRGDPLIRPSARIARSAVSQVGAAEPVAPRSCTNYARSQGDFAHPTAPLQIGKAAADELGQVGRDVRKVNRRASAQGAFSITS
jgi:hypothetical protein